jgi:hypothetical protein
LQELLEAKHALRLERFAVYQQERSAEVESDELAQHGDVTSDGNAGRQAIVSPFDVNESSARGIDAALPSHADKVALHHDKARGILDSLAIRQDAAAVRRSLHRIRTASRSLSSLRSVR